MSIVPAAVRERAIAAYEAGLGTQADVAKFYGVDLSTFQRWLQRYRETGHTAPLPRGHYPPALDDTKREELRSLVREKPEATLQQLRDELEVACSVVTIHNTLQRLGYRYKRDEKGAWVRVPEP